MDKNINNRIQQVIDALCKNNSDFCRRIGRSEYAVKDIVGGKRTFPGYELIYSILSSDLGISPKWLILGEGEMLEKSQTTAPSFSPAVNIGTIQTVNIGNWGELIELLNKK